jgi:hypothetical protein
LALCAGFRAGEGSVALSPPLARPAWQCGPGYRELTRPEGLLTLDLRGGGAAARVGGQSTLMRCALPAWAGARKARTLAAPAGQQTAMLASGTSVHVCRPALDESELRRVCKTSRGGL